MTLVSRRTVIAGLGALAATQAHAAWPERPITIVHGLAPGGGVDTTARIIAEQLAKRLGQPCIVEARTGAASTVAAAQLARSAPDGYTLGLFPGTYAAAVAMRRSIGFKPVDDFAMIGLVNEFSYVIATHRDHPVSSLSQLLKSRLPEPLLYGSPGQGTAQHLLMVQLGLQSGIEFRHVPFRGGPEVLNEVLARRLDLIIDAPIVLSEHIKSGTIRPLAVTTRERARDLPDVAAISEAGFADFDVRGWMGLLAPAGVPDGTLRRLQDEIGSILNDAVVVERFRGLGVAAKAASGDSLLALLRSDLTRWERVISDARIERI